MSHHFVECNHVCFSYPDGHRALDNISFKIIHGEAVGIVGANGAGKSTLLNLLLGIDMPSSGEINVGDIPMTKKTLPLIRQRMGLVFQNPDDQLFMNRVYDDVAFGPRSMKLEENEVERRVKAAMETTDIWQLKDKAPYKLSGGEKKRAAIAAVLSMEPDILVMDEPTAELDPRGRRRIINLLNGFTHTRIITSHDMDLIWDLCQRTIVLSHGTILADGETKEILSDKELLEKAGLELPLRLQME
jgi:cobalt/nickel transport system ATP-binding protein